MRGEILRCPWRKWEKERTCLGGYFGGEDCCDFGRFVYFKMGSDEKMEFSIENLR